MYGVEGVTILVLFAIKMLCSIPSVATYHSTGGRGEIKRCVFSKENAWSRYQLLFEENVRKTKKMPTKFENKGSGVVYTQGRY